MPDGPEGTPPALYLPDGNRLVPTIATRGPWTPDAQHGGPVAALVTRAAERTEPLLGDLDRPMAVIRVVLELLRPVPLAPLTLASQVRRAGRKVQLLDVAVRAGDREVAIARVLRLRAADVPVGVAVPPVGAAPDGVAAPRPPDDSLPSYQDERFGWLDTVGLDVRFAAGSFDAAGPATAWFRLRMPVVAGEQPSPAQRVVVAADSGSGVGAALSFGRYTFLNAELTVHLARPPAGDWIGVQAGTMVGEAGAGVTTSRLWDLDGVVGQASQALLVEQL